MLVVLTRVDGGALADMPSTYCETARNSNKAEMAKYKAKVEKGRKEGESKVKHICHASLLKPW